MLAWPSVRVSLESCRSRDCSKVARSSEVIAIAVGLRRNIFDRDTEAMMIIMSND